MITPHKVPVSKYLRKHYLTLSDIWWDPFLKLGWKYPQSLQQNHNNVMEYKELSVLHNFIENSFQPQSLSWFFHDDVSLYPFSYRNFSSAVIKTFSSFIPSHSSPWTTFYLCLFLVCKQFTRKLRLLEKCRTDIMIIVLLYINVYSL